MAAGKWKMYEAAKRDFANGLHDFDTHTFRIGLFLSTSNANDLTLANAYLADFTNQHATANGYTQVAEAAGKLVTLTTAQASGTVTIDETTNPVWTASGGSIIARFAVIFNDSHASNQAVAVCLMDTTPADVTATAGNTLTVTINASGLFTLSGAAAD
jgi:hypothetical protein